MNKRQLVIAWVMGLSVSAFFIIQPVMILPILILGGLSFWSFKDITSPLTKRFKFFIVLVIIGLVLLAISICSDYHYSPWFVKSHHEKKAKPANWFYVPSKKSKKSSGWAF